MYAQFFAHYLDDNGYADRGDILSAMGGLEGEKARIGTLAVAGGLMSAEDVDDVIAIQTNEDKMFGEVAEEEGYLSKDQLSELLHRQDPAHVTLGQALVDRGALAAHDFGEALTWFRDDCGIGGIDDVPENAEAVRRLLHAYLRGTGLSPLCKSFIRLFLHNLERFVGTDFVPLPPSREEAAWGACAGNGFDCGDGRPFGAWLAAPSKEAAAFGTRYFRSEIPEEDSPLALADFMDVQRGLFLSQMQDGGTDAKASRTRSRKKGAPAPGLALAVPVAFPFGTVTLMITEKEEKEDRA